MQKQIVIKRLTNPDAGTLDGAMVWPVKSSVGHRMFRSRLGIERSIKSMVSDLKYEPKGTTIYAEIWCTNDGKWYGDYEYRRASKEANEELPVFRYCSACGKEADEFNTLCEHCSGTIVNSEEE